MSRDKRPFYLNPARVLMFMALWIFLAELADMLIIDYLRHMSEFSEAFLDGVLLLILISPAYFILYRPLKSHWEERLRCEEEIRFLGKKLLTTTEEERSRLAREMHDECGALLSALQLGLETLKHRLSERPSDSLKHADHLIGLVAQLGGNLRTIYNRLRPVMLEQLGLIPTLEQLVKEHSFQSPKVKIDFQAEGFPRSLHPDVEIAIFRICQESLSNAVKHGRAKKIEIRLKAEGNWALLSVKDDGKGFDLKEGAALEGREGGFGLLNMRERAVLLGGKLEVVSAPGAGTLINARLPLSV